MPTLSELDFIPDKPAESERFDPAKDFQPDPVSRERQVRQDLGQMGYPVPASGEERAARDVAIKRQMGVQEAGEPSAILGQQGPVEFVNAAADLAGRAATGLANIPTRLSNIGKREEFQTPLLEANVPKAVIPQIPPEQMEGESAPVKLAAGAYNKLAAYGTAMTAPGMGLTAALLPGKAAKVFFGTTIAANIPGTIQESANILRDKKASLMEKGGALIAAPAEAFMLKQIVKSAPILPRAAKAAADAAGLTKEVPDALQRKGPQVLQPMREQPIEGAGQVPAKVAGEEVGQRGQPAPQAQEAQGTLRLTPEHEALVKSEIGSVDVPVEIVDKPANANEPFGFGRTAGINRAKGTIELYPEFANVLNEDMKGATPEQKRLAIRSTLAEERNHLATSDADADAFVKTLSWPELAIQRRIYTGKYGKTEGVTDRDIGYESIRRYFQRLARMDTTEVARAAGVEKWKLQSLEVLSDTIAGIRKRVGTKASKEGLAILAKVQANLDAAKVAVGGQPASLRRTEEPEEPQNLKVALAAYEDTGKIETVRDLADTVDGLIAEGKAPESLKEALDSYREELRQDFEEFAGRSDMDEAEANFLSAVKKASKSEGAPASLRRKTPEESQQSEVARQISTKDWWHVPPADESAYGQRGKFYSSSYKESEFYGAPAELMPEKAAVRNPLIGDEAHIETELLGERPPAADPDSPTFYKDRTALDARLAAAAKARGYDSIALLTPKGFETFKQTGKLPRSVELNTLHNVQDKSAVPPIKYVGSKRWLVPKLSAVFDEYRDRRLVEPFFGGGSVTLGLKPERALVNDINPQVENLYREIGKGLVYDLPYKRTPADFEKARNYANQLLSKGITSGPEIAKLYYYINKTGYNGLWRVNSEGKLNTPFGVTRKQMAAGYNTSPLKPDFTPWRDAFRRIQFKQGDFTDVPIKSGDFVYADPPYPTQFGERGYSAEGFGMDKQRQLAEKLADHDGPVIISNADTPELVKLYKSLGYELTYAERRGTVSSDAEGRQPVMELLAYKNLSPTAEAKLTGRAEAGPASLRRKTPEEQQSFFLPPAERGVERPGATEAGAAKYQTERYLTPDKVNWEGSRKEAAFRRITDAEAKSPEALAEILSKGASEGGSDIARSNTRKVVVLQDRYSPSGRIEVVSAYKDPRGDVRMADPSSLSDDKQRPHRPYDQLLDRYTPLYTVSLKEPVRNFHERFDSMQQFQEAFGNAAAEEAAKRAPAPAGETLTRAKTPALGGQAGTGRAAPFQAEQFTLPVEPEPVPAPQDAEAGAIHDFFRGKKPASADEMIQTMTRGGVTANRQMLSALKRMMEYEQFKDPNLSAKEALDKSVRNIYDDLTQSKDRADFTQRTLGRFAEQAAGIDRPTAAQAPAAPEGSLEAGASQPGPASLRRIKEARDATLAEADRIYTGVKSLITRRDISDAIPATLDAADTVANNVGREFETSIRVSAGATGKNRRGDMKILTAANPMRDSGAVVGKFKMSDLTPAAQNKFQTLFRDYLAKHPAGPPIATRIEALRSATAQLINDGDLRADRLTYSFNDQAKSALPTFMNQVDTAAAKARVDIKTAGWFERRILTKKLKFLQKLREEILEADRSWNDPKLRETAIAAQREFDQIFQRGVDFGSNLHYDPDYAPGRYEGEFISEGKILFPGMNVLGGRWKSPKVFKNIYEAVNAGPYMSLTRDIASMVGHRARQEERAIGRQQWVANFKNLIDPDSGLPVGADPKKDVNGNPQPPSSDYEIVYPFRNKPVAVHRGWSKLVRTLTGESKVQEFAPARVILEAEQRLKHTLLVGDFFHLGRLSYYAASIMGRKAGFHGGLAAIDFREADLPRAVKQGLVSKEAADWVTERIPVKIGGKDVMFSRRQIADGFQRQGLNVGQIQDALYKDLTGNVPLVGPYNKWLFDSYTRGLMMESAVREFERMNKANPAIDSRVLMRDVAKDINRFYGSIGRQGWFKSKTWQDLSRLAFLAPQWVEGLVMKEAGTYKRAAYAATGARALGVVGGRQGLPALGTLARGIGRGMMAMFVLTQAINLITRGKPTWMNEEEGHKGDAWLWGGDHGFFLNPASVFNELSHDLWRYGETKPKAWDAVNQIGQNKLSPFGRLALVLATSKAPTGEYQTSSAGVIGKAAEQLAPVPISFGRAARELGHAVAPGAIAPNAPGAFQRQAMQWAGLKAEPAGSASQRVGVMARRFMEANGLGQKGFQFEPTDQPSYMKLRTALRNGDNAAAVKIMQQIGKTPTEIGKAFKGWAARPWTGSKKADRAFFATLSDQELETVSAARLERQQLLEKFYDLLLTQPSPPSAQSP